jgi:hypothetical protein
MIGLRETDEKEITVGFRVPEYLIEIVDILCENEDLNRSQFFRRALDAYKPLRSAMSEFEREMASVDGISKGLLIPQTKSSS